MIFHMIFQHFGVLDRFVTYKLQLFSSGIPAAGVLRRVKSLKCPAASWQQKGATPTGSRGRKILGEMEVSLDVAIPSSLDG